MQLKQTKWETALRLPDILPGNQVTVVYGTGSCCTGQVCESTLTSEELTRADRIGDEASRRTWIRSHMVLRTMAGEYLGLEPRMVPVAASEHGKLFIPGSNLAFSLSHTDNSFLAAFSTKGTLGADLEILHGHEKLADLVAFAFSRAEAKYCQNGEIPGKFLEIWTLKEAYLKANGAAFPEHPSLLQVHGSDSLIRTRGFISFTFLSPGGETASVVCDSPASFQFYCLKE